MPLKSLARELKEKRDDGGRGGSMSKRVVRAGGTTKGTMSLHGRGDPSPQPPRLEQRQGRWANLPPELLLDVIRRVDESEASWPARRNLLGCAAVCRSWRGVTMEVVKPPEQCGRITFPISLKQPAPRDHPIQCFIRRVRSTSTFGLYLGLSPSLQVQNDKLLLAARKIRRATSVDFVISLTADEFSRASSSYIGKVRSNFLGTKFTVYDSQPPYNAAASSSSSSNRRRINSKQVSPRLTAGNYNVATISYELNVLRTRGPRRIQCAMHSIPASSVEEGGSVPAPSSFIHTINDQPTFDVPIVNDKDLADSCAPPPPPPQLVLKNKAPRWHEQLQCWCLNFRGRVTVASVKNFQLVAAVDSSSNITLAQQERVVILQFGKIGKDIFTMDYRYPLSAFQAFAICLTSFDTKPACE
ncbi:tubby-like F-box protein 5 [Curcuma longa]|uniref:tubby-like F-box protein 5 n=1 Tax=Curcuma longa TaxID=136217 RepID=UPI003D9E5792